MERMTKCGLIILLALTMFSCKKEEADDDNGNVIDPVLRTFTGKVQKGPFITGTTLTLNELNEDLGQTGKSFTATIQTDDGGFELKNIEIDSALALFTATGFYFNELYGELSYAPLTLQAIVDLSGTSVVNVNIMTHLVKDRIMKLMQEGLSFQNAKSQSQDELLAFFGITLPDGEPGFEQADISQDSELNAALLAISIVVQRYTTNMIEKPTLTAELIQLMSSMSNDFKNDGDITGQSIIDTILYNISMANLVKIRQHLEKRYADLGFPATVPDFEKYVSAIQQHLTENWNTEYLYPDMASPYFQYQNDTSAWVLNLLNMNTSNYGIMCDYSVAAIVPFDSALTVKFIIPQGNFSITPSSYHGWQKINQSQTGFSIRSILQNTIITMAVGFGDSGTAVIEFYKNNDTVPYRVKNITFQ